MLTPEAYKALDDFMMAFLAVYKRDSYEGKVILASIFTSSFAIMEAADRVSVLQAIKMVADDVRFEKFEDAVDFVSFLQEKNDERKIQYGDFLD